MFFFASIYRQFTKQVGESYHVDHFRFLAAERLDNTKKTTMNVVRAVCSENAFVFKAIFHACFFRTFGSDFAKLNMTFAKNVTIRFKGHGVSV